jgi:hypothetical protein
MNWKAWFIALPIWSEQGRDYIQRNWFRRLVEINFGRGSRMPGAFVEIVYAKPARVSREALVAGFGGVE